jgi:ubiquinone/menaquinone biosynthesis C-methylase UbiE
MNIQSAYNQWAASYDADLNLTRDLDQQVTREMLGHLRPNALLEIGCGTGKNTQFLAQISQQVHALDFSEGMIAQAKNKIDAAHVRFSVADLTKPWPVEADRHDLVVCNLVLEHIEDIAFVFRQAFHTLTPGGCFYVAELHPFKQYMGSQARFVQGGDEYKIPAFLHHISDYLTAAEEAGFTLHKLREWWHVEDANKPPRLISFVFVKPA